MLWKRFLIGCISAPFWDTALSDLSFERYFFVLSSKSGPERKYHHGDLVEPKEKGENRKKTSKKKNFWIFFEKCSKCHDRCKKWKKKLILGPTSFSGAIHIRVCEYIRMYSNSSISIEYAELKSNSIELNQRIPTNTWTNTNEYLLKSINEYFEYYS